MRLVCGYQAEGPRKKAEGESGENLGEEILVKAQILRSKGSLPTRIRRDVEGWGFVQSRLLFSSMGCGCFTGGTKIREN